MFPNIIGSTQGNCVTLEEYLAHKQILDRGFDLSKNVASKEKGRLRLYGALKRCLSFQTNGCNEVCSAAAELCLAVLQFSPRLCFSSTTDKPEQPEVSGMAGFGVGPCISVAALQVGVAAFLPCSVRHFAVIPSGKKKGDSQSLCFFSSFFSAVQNVKRPRKQKRVLNLEH